MKLHNIGGTAGKKYHTLVPVEIVEKVLHWSPEEELDYDVQFMDGQPVLCIAAVSKK
jgi:hypothetical protein